ncbi:hypothetical protein [uncultured Paraglaciecola sp.]|uniref:hypothetical protein n=1 Tax=uncultured Paraglaciecola sp. TaxID=1765024 RepID=UPI00262F50A0|nr:hypothetical protein [uncultured Paraglaciecola sp.]
MAEYKKALSAYRVDYSGCTLFTTMSPEISRTSEVFTHLLFNGEDLFYSTADAKSSMVYVLAETDTHRELQLSSSSTTLTRENSPSYQWIKPINKQQKVCHSANNTECTLACANAVAATDTLLQMEQNNHVLATPNIEVIQEKYIKQCVQLSRQHKLLSQPSQQALTALVDKSFSSKSNLYVRPTNKSNNSDSLYQSKPKELAPHDTLRGMRGELLGVDVNDLVESFVVAHNYCPISNNGFQCVPIPYTAWLEPIIGISDPNRSTDNLFMDIKFLLEKFATDADIDTRNAYFTEYGYAPLDSYQLSANPTAAYITQASHSFLVPQIVTMRKFLHHAFNWHPEETQRNDYRYYCESAGKKAQNPFINSKGACEYLSAIYYGDFGQLITLDALFAEPLVRTLENEANAAHQFLWKVFKGQKISDMRRQINRMSMMPFIIMSYLMDYSLNAKGCLGDDAVDLTYQFNSVTEIRNRWGYTKKSFDSSTTEKYYVSPAWAASLEKTGLNLSSDSAGMFAQVDVGYQNSKYTKEAEKEYGLERPSLRAVTSAIHSDIIFSSCDNPHLIKLDKRLLEYAHFLENRY